MRVIAGSAKGKRLKAPSGRETRPITDMVKEALFNVLGPGIKDARFLDLFAGSGSVGIEALSRGAAIAVFVDNNPKAVRIIYENLDNCGFGDNYEVYCNDVLRALTILDKRKAKFDYIYVDPPFNVEGIFMDVMKKLDQVEIMAPQGIIIIRTRRHKELPASFNCLKRYRLNYYGESALHYYSLMA
ncbi:MAG: 16S rRNA (guanine(966)-N(2))-methyltransferase RsmD [Syntrophomonadaceae bacterium]|nr:16S rRNA (guanine(966)-N(2))-methyltransferase RsmD [Syntrophomonadaceae bacterium]